MPNIFESKYDKYYYRLVLKNDILYFSDGDAAFFELFGKKPYDMGMRADKFFNPQLYKAMYRMCYNTRINNGEPAYCVRELSFAIWNVLLTYDFPYFTFRATLIGSAEDFSQYSMKHSCSDRISSGSVLLNITEEDDLIVESCQDATFPTLIPGKSAKGVLDHLCRIRSASVIIKIMEQNKPVRFYDVYSDTSHESFIMATLTPIMHESKKILVNIDKLSEKEYYKQQSIASLDYLRFIKNDSLAIAIMTSPDKDGLLYENALFRDTITSRRDNFSQLCVSPIIKESYLNRCETTGYFEAADGEKYFVCVTLSLGGDERYVFIATHGNISSAFSDNGKLTPREREIMQYVVEGDSNKAIADKLLISEGTVKKTVYNTYRKLGVRSRVELIRRVLFG